MKIARLSFNAGEISPVLWWRSDLAKYSSSCKKIENYINIPQGGVRRRFGTQNFFRIGDVNDNARAIVWEVDRNVYFQLVFIDGQILIFNNDGGLVEVVASTPYSGSDLDELYFKQVYDIMYLAHPDYPVQELRRTASTSWTLAEFDFRPAPMGEPNTTSITITPTLGVDPDYTLTASTALFSANDVGRDLRLVSDAPLSYSGTFGTGDQGLTGGLTHAVGKVTMRTEGGIWDGRLELQELKDGATEWIAIGSVTSENGNHNGEIIRDIEGFNSQIRVLMAERGNATSDNGCRWTLEVDETQYTYFKITSFTSDTVVNADRIGGDPLASNAVEDWSLGAFGGDNGYPTCLEIHEERMMLAGVLGTPATVYGSRINDWTNFQSGTLATSPIRFTLSSDVRNRTRWMSTETSLIMGTDYGEWTIGSRDGSTALSGENVSAKRHTQYGSNPRQEVTASDMTLYIESGGRRIRSMQYNFAEKDGYVSVDMNILAPHLTKDFGFTRMAYSRVPEQIIWCVREDGELCAFTHERDQQVTAWSRHPFSDGGKVVDVNSFLTNDGDVVTMLVNRNDGLYLEVIQKDNICLDWQREYSLEDDYVVSVEGDEAFKYYDSALGESARVKSSDGVSSYIRLINPPADLVVKYGGDQIDNSDLIDMGSDMLWLSYATDKSLITVFDFDVPLVEGVDYELYDSTKTQCVQILSDAVDLNVVDLYIGAVQLVENTDFWIMPNVRQYLVIDVLPTDVIDPKILGNNLVDEVYRNFVPSQNFGSTIDTVFVGIPMISELETTDIANSPSSGGGGNKVRTDEVDIFVVDSAGGEISVDGGDCFSPILSTPKNVVAGERIPPFTGKKEVQTQHGYSEDQTIIVRNSTPYNSIIASIGAHTEGYSK